MDASLEVGQLRQELSHAERTLQLEKERRIRAERQAEAEKQACLQLQLLLARERKLRGYGRPPAQTPPRAGVDAGRPREQAGGDPPPSGPSPPRNNTSGSEGNSTLSHLDELTSSIFGDLPDDLQEMLGLCCAPVGAQPVISRAEEAVRVDDAKELRACLLLEGGKALSDSDKQKLLDLASENGHTGCVEVLLDAGCHPEVRLRQDGLGPLHLAALHGHTECAKVLLTVGPDSITATGDKEGCTPLFLSLHRGHYECASLLLHEAKEETLANITKSGQSCLHAAVIGHLPHLLRALLVHITTSFEPSMASDIINHPDVDGITALHLAATNGYQDCMQVLCGCKEVVTSHRDRWNRTSLDVCAECCKELLLNRDCREVTVRIDMVDGLADPDPSAVGRVHLMAHHSWSDMEMMVMECLQDFCQHLKGTSPITLPHHHPTESLSPHCLGSSPLAAHLKRVLGDDEGQGGRGQHLVEVLHTMQSFVSVMDWNGGSVSGYRIGDMRWKPGDRTQTMSGKGPLAFLISLDSMSDCTRVSDILITLKGPSQGCLDLLGWELMVPVSTLQQYVQVVENEKAVIVQGPRGSGKTSIVKGIADYFKVTKQASVINFSCHSSIKREDLLRLFHLNGLLVEGSRIIDDGSSISSVGSSHHKPQILILDDLDRLGETFADLLSILNYRGPDHSQWIDAVCDRDGNVAFSAGQYHLSETCYIVATRNAASGEHFAPEQFAFVLLEPFSEPSIGMLQRHLRRKLIDRCHGNVPHRSDPLYTCVQWIWNIWYLYNHVVVHLELPELVIGPKLFFTCPVEGGNPEEAYSWLRNLWNHRMAPSIEGHLLNKMGPRAVYEMLSGLVHSVFKPLCPLSHQAKNAVFQTFSVGSAIMDHTTQTESSGQEDSHISHLPGKNIEVAIHPVPMESGVAATPPVPRKPLDSPSLRNTSQATIVSYKDMIRNSPQFREKNAKSSKTKKKPDIDNSDTVSIASETGSLSGTRGRAKTLSIFGRDSSFRLPKLFKRNSLKGPQPAKEAFKAKKGEGAEPRTSPSDLHDLYDMISRIGDTRLDEQRSPAPPPSTSVSPNPYPSPASSLRSSVGVVPKYILATSTPQDQRHQGSSPSGGATPSPSLLHHSQKAVKNGSTPDMVGGVKELEEEEEGGASSCASKQDEALELDLSVSSGSGSHSCLTSWVEVGEGVRDAPPTPTPAPVPAPAPIPQSPQTRPQSSSSDDHHSMHPPSPHHDCSPLRPPSSSSSHPLEFQQRSRGKRDSWLSDTWDDSSSSLALSFSASLGFEPSSFGKKDHKRFSMALMGQEEEEEVGAEL